MVSHRGIVGLEDLQCDCEQTGGRCRRPAGGHSRASTAVTVGASPESGGPYEAWRAVSAPEELDDGPNEDGPPAGPTVTFGHTRSLLDTFGLLIAADEAHGEPQTWVMIHTGGMGPRAWAGVSDWPVDAEVPSEHTIDELAERELVRMLSIKGNGRTFAITEAGREARAKHQADAILDVRAIDLTWESPRATLERIYALDRSPRGPMGVAIMQLTQDRQSGAQVEARSSTSSRVAISRSVAAVPQGRLTCD